MSRNSVVGSMIFALGCLGGFACVRSPVDLSGRACELGHCVTGNTCHPQLGICVDEIRVGCGIPDAICPDDIHGGERCHDAGTFIPCEDQTDACDAGCRTCGPDLTWGECVPSVGQDGAGGDGTDDGPRPGDAAGDGPRPGDDSGLGDVAGDGPGDAGGDGLGDAAGDNSGPAWRYRKQILIDGGSVVGNHSSYPLLVSITDPDLRDNAQTGGEDIYFTASDGTSRLDHEVEQFNGSTGRLIAWVSIPSLTPNVDTVIYMYYGNSSTGPQQTPAAVWDGSFVGVWHLSEAGTGSRFDSTGNANDASPLGYDGDENVGGFIGRADSFDGVDDRLEAVGVAGPSTALTYEMWLRPDAALNSTNGREDLLYGINGPRPHLTFNREGNGSIILHVTVGTTYDDVSTTTTSWSVAWHHIAYTWDGTDFRVYVDGTRQRTVPHAGTHAATTGMSIGGTQAGNSLFTGRLDEVRISNVRRSGTWIETNYNNQTNPGDVGSPGFCTIGSQEAL